MTAREKLLLLLRVTLEVGVVAGLCVWGYSLGSIPGTRAALAIALPAVGFGLWGAIDFRNAGRAAEPLRLTQELVISGLAAAAFAAAGHIGFGIALAVLSLAYHALVYACGARLLRH